MAGRLRNRVALVVGAGSSGPGWGNGKAAAVLFAREGAKVFCVDINPAAAEETVEIIRGEGGEASAHEADVTDGAQVGAMVERCVADYGRIDVLENNVGILEVGGPVEASEASWERVLRVNLTSMFLTCKHVLPVMERQGKGAIVNIGSVSGLRWLGVPYISYSASKGAVVPLTRSIALEYAGKGIRANAVLPGLTDTKFAGALVGNEALMKSLLPMIPQGRVAEPAEIAPAFLYLVSDAGRYVTGASLTVDGGFLA